MNDEASKQTAEPTLPYRDADPEWARLHQGMAELGVSIDGLVFERNNLRGQKAALLEELQEIATTASLASVGRGPATLEAAVKRLAHIAQTAQNAIEAAS